MNCVSKWTQLFVLSCVYSYLFGCASYLMSSSCVGNRFFFIAAIGKLVDMCLMLSLLSEWFAHLHMTLKLLTLPHSAHFHMFSYSPLAILLIQMLVVKIK